MLTFALDKTQLSLPPPHCGVHIAQSRETFPDHPAQTLFDLLNLHNFALSYTYRNLPKRRCPSAWGGICMTATLPFWFVQKEGGARNWLLFHQKRGASFFGQRSFGYSHSFLVLPPMQRILVRAWSVFCAVFRNYRRDPASFVERPNTKVPTSLQKTGFVGSGVIS